MGRPKKVADSARANVQRMALSDLSPAPYNPRRISEDALAGLQASLGRFGLVQPPIFNERTGHLVGGHQRVKAALSLGETECDVVVVDIDPGEERALNVALNSPHIAGEFTDDLQGLLGEIEDFDAGLFTELRLDELLLPVATDGLVDEDDAPPPPEEPVSTLGDLWALEGHRIICGDCRDLAVVKRLLDGGLVNVAFTSPPYASQRKYDETSGFKPIRPDEYVDWFDDVQANVRAVLADAGSWFVNIKEHCDGGQRHLYVKDLTIAHVRQWAWMFVDEFCWRDTKNGVPGGWNNRFKDAWEPVFHFASAGGIKFNPLANGVQSDAVFDYSASTATTATGSGLLGVKATDERSGIARPSNVVELAAASTGNHSAAFPVGLPEFFVRAFSDVGDRIFDPFMGSGTTLIASETHDRIGLGCELSPAYVDVIVRRWQNFTGKEATLDGDGRTFNEIAEARGG